MKLRKKQREYLLQLIAEGLQIGEINERTAQFKPRFKVTPQQVDYYRQSRGLKLDEIQESGEVDALKSGLALKANRVEKLQALAEHLLGDLLGDEENRLWLDQVKGIGSQDNYERVEYQTFNTAEVEAVRGLLDDIASEVGDRIKRVDATSDGKPLQSATPEQIAQRVAALMELAKQRKDKDGR